MRTAGRPGTMRLASWDPLAVAEAARDAGQEVCLFGRQGGPLLVGVGRRWDLVSHPGGVALEGAEGVVDGEAGPPLLAATRLWRRVAATEPSLVALGGFAFDVDREPGPPWAGFPALLFRVPALILVHGRGRTTVRGEVELLQERPVWSPGQGRRFELEPSRPAEDWTEMVARARRRLRAGEANKVVLAREVMAHGDGPLSAGQVVRRLAARYPGCFLYLVTGSDGTAFAGASPELLVGRRGSAVRSQPMAGSARRGASAPADEELGRQLLGSAKEMAEHRATAGHVVSALAALGAQVRSAEPHLVRLSNIQHLATTISAWFPGRPPGLLELAAALHPTPAVGGSPPAAALGLIRELEGMERGWYAGAVGWMDGREDGELAVAIRCGLLFADGARLYAGCGIMPDSDPEAELEETELKLQALLDGLRAPG
jgi:isochorismate synthase